MPELTGRHTTKQTSKFSMKDVLFALRLNELLGCALGKDQAAIKAFSKSFESSIAKK
jgi:hypothetical protein